MELSGKLWRLNWLAPAVLLLSCSVGVGHSPEVLPDDFLRIGFYLHETDCVKSRPLCREGKAADPGEKIDVRHTVTAHFSQIQPSPAWMSRQGVIGSLHTKQRGGSGREGWSSWAGFVFFNSFPPCLFPPSKPLAFFFRHRLLQSQLREYLVEHK